MRMAAARGNEAAKFRAADEAHLAQQYAHRLYYYKHRELGTRCASCAPDRVSLAHCSLPQVLSFRRENFGY